MEAKQRLIDWFNDERTPVNAWASWKLREIAAAAGVSEHTVKVVLPKLVKDKFAPIHSYHEFKEFRAAYRIKNRVPGSRLPDDEIEKIQQKRRDGGDLISITHDTGYSYKTVQKYCKGIKRGKKRRK